SRSVSRDAWTTRPRLATIAPTRSAGAGATAGSAKEALHFVEDRGGDLVLGRLGDRALAAGVDQRDLVLARLEADVGAAHVVEYEQVGVLGLQLLPCPLETSRALVGGEADEQPAGAAVAAQRRQHVGRRLQLDRPRAAVLRPLGRQCL